ncbi:MAG: FAD-dependent oxidoreductase, partial [Novosphingobium sp.]|nr:FAD-dependent oxidoreductase [Novosphingobium sp.]
LAEELGLADRVAENGQEILLIRKGRLYSIDATKPLRAIFTGALSWRSKLAMLKTIADFRRIDPPIDVLDVSRSAAGTDVESAHDYALRRLNREIYDVLVDPMIRTYVIRRGSDVSALEWFSALSNLAGQKLVAMTGGIDTMAKRLAEEVDVRTRCPVTSVVRRPDNRVEVQVRDEAEPLVADACVMATRLHQADAILPELRDLTGPLLEKLAYNPTVVVNLGYAASMQSGALGVLLGTVECEELSLVWFDHNKDPGTAPRGHSLVSCFFDAAALPALEGASDDRYVEIAEEFLLQHFPELRGHRDMEHVTRWADAIPNPAPGSYSAVAEFKQGLDPADPVQLAGDYFTCTGQNSAIHWGQVAAGNIDRHIGRRNAAING